MDDFLADEMMRLRMGFAVSSPNAQAKLTGADGSKRAVRDALANLEETNPDEAALLQEHLDTGKSTDLRWQD
jgi:hypothetical protein